MPKTEIPLKIPPPNSWFPTSHCFQHSQWEQGCKVYLLFISTMILGLCNELVWAPFYIQSIKHIATWIQGVITRKHGCYRRDETRDRKLSIQYEKRNIPWISRTTYVPRSICKTQAHVWSRLSHWGFHHKWQRTVICTKGARTAIMINCVCGHNPQQQDSICYHPES